MQSTSAPQVSHMNRLPSWFGMVGYPLLLQLHGLAATRELALSAALGDDHFAIADRAQIALAHDISHYRILLFDWDGVVPQRQCYANFSLGSTEVAGQRTAGS